MLLFLIVFLPLVNLAVRFYLSWQLILIKVCSGSRGLVKGHDPTNIRVRRLLAFQSFIENQHHSLHIDDERSQVFGEVSYVKCLWLDRLMVGARLDRRLSVDRVRVTIGQLCVRSVWQSVCICVHWQSGANPLYRRMRWPVWTGARVTNRCVRD